MNLFIMFAGTSVAQIDSTAVSGGGPSFFWVLIQSVFALVVVIAGIIAFVWVLKQFMGRSVGSTGESANSELRLIQQFPLSPKQSIFLVRILDDLYVLSNSDEDLTLLHRYEEFQRWDSIELHYKPGANGFAQFFQKTLSRGKANK